jgi:broad specificity phosphatase PhoE
VSSEEAFAAQIPGFTAADVARVAFFREWLTAPDRVGWWVRHPGPPGDDAAAVAARIRTFAASLADRVDSAALTVAITHSPVLRACALDVTGGDIGEPRWLAGLEAEISTDRSVRLSLLPEAP